MKLFIEQLDGRFKGRKYWTHRVEFRHEWGAVSREQTFNKFLQTRIQLWEMYGPGCDREEIHRVKNATQTTPDWGWWIDPKGSMPYIYFKNGPILTWFLMQV